MITRPVTNPNKRQRFPAEITSHWVWLYFRLRLSYRDGAALMAERGDALTDESVWYCRRTSGQPYANQLRCRQPGPGDKWHPDEAFLTIHGERHYLRRAVDHDGHVLDSLVRRRRDTAAAKKLFRKLLKGFTYVPRVIVTDMLRSPEAAKRALLPGVEPRQRRSLNHRAENSHQPTRQRERTRRRCIPAGQAPRFLAAYGPLASPFRPRCHLLPARVYRQEMTRRFQAWREITGPAMAA